MAIKQILILDDEPSVVHALKLLLQVLGFECPEFTEPKVALKYISEGNTPDLFLSDLRMPELDGFDVFFQLQQINPSIPFVLMSAHADRSDIKKIKDLGGNGFLPKPFTPDQLKEMIGEL